MRRSSCRTGRCCIPADAGGSGSNWTGSADHTRFVVVNDPDGTAQTFRVLTNWQGNRDR